MILIVLIVIILIIVISRRDPQALQPRRNPSPSKEPSCPAPPPIPHNVRRQWPPQGCAAGFPFVRAMGKTVCILNVYNK